MNSKKKFYTVLIGRQKGIFDSWEECKKSVQGFPSACFKSFHSREDAEQAWQENFFRRQSKGAKQKTSNANTNIPTSGIVVDGACSNNPGLAEYRGVNIETGVELFSHTPFLATNNVAEFVAIVHAMAYCIEHNLQETTLYSDSVNAILWIKKGICKSTLKDTSRYPDNKFDYARRLIAHSEKWLKEHKNVALPRLVKWDTENWGENPADYGRK